MDNTYDLRELAKENLHIHSTYSDCAKPEMQIVPIIETALRCGLKKIAITDHFNDRGCPILKQNAEMREMIGRRTGGMKVLFGGELSAYGIGKFLDTEEVNKSLDYRLYTCNHFHLRVWEHPEDKSARGYADHMLASLNALFDSKRADCIAHPFIGRFIRAIEDKTLVTKAITDAELGDIMVAGKSSNCAWEINVGAVFGDPEFYKRYWNIGKENGVTFNMATDAHVLAHIDTAQFISDLAKILA